MSKATTSTSTASNGGGAGLKPPPPVIMYKPGSADENAGGFVRALKKMASSWKKRKVIVTPSSFQYDDPETGKIVGSFKMTEVTEVRSLTPAAMKDQGSPDNLMNQGWILVASGRQYVFGCESVLVRDTYVSYVSQLLQQYKKLPQQQQPKTNNNNNNNTKKIEDEEDDFSDIDALDEDENDVVGGDPMKSGILKSSSRLPDSSHSSKNFTSATSATAVSSVPLTSSAFAPTLTSSATLKSSGVAMCGHLQLAPQKTGLFSSWSKKYVWLTEDGMFVAAKEPADFLKASNTEKVVKDVTYLSFARGRVDVGLEDQSRLLVMKCPKEISNNGWCVFDFPTNAMFLFAAASIKERDAWIAAARDVVECQRVKALTPEELQEIGLFQADEVEVRNKIVAENETVRFLMITQLSEGRDRATITAQIRVDYQAIVQKCIAARDEAIQATKDAEVAMKKRVLEEQQRRLRSLEENESAERKSDLQQAESQAFASLREKHKNSLSSAQAATRRRIESEHATQRDSIESANEPQARRRLLLEYEAAVSRLQAEQDQILSAVSEEEAQRKMFERLVKNLTSSESEDRVALEKQKESFFEKSVWKEEKQQREQVELAVKQRQEREEKERKEREKKERENVESSEVRERTEAVESEKSGYEFLVRSESEGKQAAVEKMKRNLQNALDLLSVSHRSAASDVRTDEQREREEMQALSKSHQAWSSKKQQNRERDFKALLQREQYARQKTTKEEDQISTRILDHDEPEERSAAKEKFVSRITSEKQALQNLVASESATRNDVVASEKSEIASFKKDLVSGKERIEKELEERRLRHQQERANSEQEESVQRKVLVTSESKSLQSLKEDAAKSKKQVERLLEARRQKHKLEREDCERSETAARGSLLSENSKKRQTELVEKELSERKEIETRLLERARLQKRERETSESSQDKSRSELEETERTELHQVREKQSAEKIEIEDKLSAALEAEQKKIYEAKKRMLEEQKQERADLESAEEKSRKEEITSKEEQVFSQFQPLADKSFSESRDAEKKRLALEAQQSAKEKAEREEAERKQKEKRQQEEEEAEKKRKQREAEEEAKLQEERLKREKEEQEEAEKQRRKKEEEEEEEEEAEKQRVAAELAQKRKQAAEEQEEQERQKKLQKEKQEAAEAEARREKEEAEAATAIRVKKPKPQQQQQQEEEEVKSNNKNNSNSNNKNAKNINNNNKKQNVTSAASSSSSSSSAPTVNLASPPAPAFMFKPGSEDENAGGFVRALKKMTSSWKKRKVTVNPSMFQYEDPESGKSLGAIRLADVTEARPLTPAVMKEKGSPDNLQKSGWMLTAAGKHYVFACENISIRDSYVGYLSHAIRQRVDDCDFGDDEEEEEVSPQPQKNKNQPEKELDWSDDENNEKKPAPTTTTNTTRVIPSMKEKDPSPPLDSYASPSPGRVTRIESQQQSPQSPQIQQQQQQQQQQKEKQEQKQEDEEIEAPPIRSSSSPSPPPSLTKEQDQEKEEQKEAERVELERLAKQRQEQKEAEEKEEEQQKRQQKKTEQEQQEEEENRHRRQQEAEKEKEREREKQSSQSPPPSVASSPSSSRVGSSASPGLMPPAPAMMYKPGSADENAGGFVRALKRLASSWKKRKVIVNPAMLQYEDIESGKVIGSLRMADITEIKQVNRGVMKERGCPDNIINNGWLLVAGGREYVFACETAAVRDAYVVYMLASLSQTSSNPRFSKSGIIDASLSQTNFIRTSITSSSSVASGGGGGGLSPNSFASSPVKNNNNTSLAKAASSPSSSLSQQRQQQQQEEEEEKEKEVEYSATMDWDDDETEEDRERKRKEKEEQEKEEREEKERKEQLSAERKRKQEEEAEEERKKREKEQAELEKKRRKEQEEEARQQRLQKEQQDRERKAEALLVKMKMDAQSAAERNAALSTLKKGPSGHVVSLKDGFASIGTVVYKYNPAAAAASPASSPQKQQHQQQQQQQAQAQQQQKLQQQSSGLFGGLKKIFSSSSSIPSPTSAASSSSPPTTTATRATVVAVGTRWEQLFLYSDSRQLYLCRDADECSVPLDRILISEIDSVDALSPQTLLKDPNNAPPRGTEAFGFQVRATSPGQEQRRWSLVVETHKTQVAWIQAVDNALLLYADTDLQKHVEWYDSVVSICEEEAENRLALTQEELEGYTAMRAFMLRNEQNIQILLADMEEEREQENSGGRNRRRSKNNADAKKLFPYRPPVCGSVRAPVQQLSSIAKNTSLTSAQLMQDPTLESFALVDDDGFCLAREENVFHLGRSFASHSGGGNNNNNNHSSKEKSSSTAAAAAAAGSGGGNSQQQQQQPSRAGMTQLNSALVASIISDLSLLTHSTITRKALPVTSREKRLSHSQYQHQIEGAVNFKGQMTITVETVSGSAIVIQRTNPGLNLARRFSVPPQMLSSGSFAESARDYMSVRHDSHDSANSPTAAGGAGGTSRFRKMIATVMMTTPVKKDPNAASFH